MEAGTNGLTLTASMRADEDVWTGEHVGQLMIAAFRVSTGVPMYSRRYGHIEALEEMPSGPCKVLSWLERFLPPKRGLHRARQIVGTWAAARALRWRDPDASIAEWCRDHRIHEATFNRTRKRALMVIAKRLNQRKIPVFHL